MDAPSREFSGPPADPPQLSIIIVNFETPDYTLECIRSIRAHPPSCPYEILLIDNGSRDGSLETVLAQAPGVTGIETGENWGFGRANNLGIERSRGEYVLLLNSDTKILDNSLDRLFQYLRCRPLLGAAGPRQLDGEGRLQLSWGHFPTLVSETFRKLLHERLALNDWRVREYLEEKYSESADADWVSGSCLIARKRALEQVGAFDARFFMYFEDIDLCRRLRDAGWEVHYHSDPVVIHYGGVSAKRNLPRALTEYRRSQLHFTRTYYGLAGEALLRVLLTAKYLLHALRWGGVYAARRLRHADAAASHSRLTLSLRTLRLLLEPL